MTDQDRLIEMIMDEFKGLARHPRPSHHEKAVSDYLVNRLHALGVTDVIRAEEHLSNTPRQLAIYEALGYTVRRFGHISLILGSDHK